MTMSHQHDEHPVISDLCFHLSKSYSTKAVERTESGMELESSSRKEVDNNTTVTGNKSGDVGVDEVGKQPHHSSSSIPLPVAAIRVLLNVVQRSKAETMMGLQAELRDASDVMVNFAKLGGPVVCTTTATTATSSMDSAKNQTLRYVLAGRSYIALSSGCELFLKYVTRASLDTPHFQQCKFQVLERGTRFAELALMARSRIAHIGCSFINDGNVILTHGRSSVVESLLVRAARVEKKRFNVIVLEGRPDSGGAKSAKAYANAGIPTTVVLDSAMGYIMERVDMVLVGAEGVVENGGIVNKVGTYSLGVLAKELGVPLFVAAESYKFTRLYPLNNADLPDMRVRTSGTEMGMETGGGVSGLPLKFLDTLAWSANTASLSAGGNDISIQHDNALSDSRSLHPYIVYLPPSVAVENPPVDFTPAKFITLLFTDLGVLTPSAVSDELIRLYQ